MAADASSRVLGETMFYCMPLRLGVFVVAIFQLIVSVLWCVDKAGWEYTFRHMMGGYALASRLVVGVIEVSGIVTAVLGIMGCWFVKPSYIYTYMYWQYLRCAGLLVIYLVDVPLLANCEGWVNSIDQMQKEHGWNAVMYDLAIGGYCNSERTLYFLLTAITFALCWYAASCSRRYAAVMDQAPRHLLRVPKDLPSGAYYASSTGERARLNGNGVARGQGIMAPNTPFQGAPQRFGTTAAV